MGHYAIKGGKIWDNEDGGRFVPNGEFVMEFPEEDDRVISLEEDDLIVPGLIDCHMHIWSPASTAAFGLASEKHYAEGFTGGIDAGTFGLYHWEEADRYWRNALDIELKSFVSLLPEGLTKFPPTDPTRPEEIDPDDYVDLINRYKDKGRLLGTKFQLGWLEYKSEETDTAMIAKGREIADRTGTHMMIHISGQCMKASESPKYMMKDDIITHPYSGFPNTILDENGNLLKEVIDAKDRGVLFDVGHAGKHFSWDVFKKAHAQGLMFDTMGGDLCVPNYRVPTWSIWDLFHVLSGFLNLGTGLDECFRALITKPAEYLGLDVNIGKHFSILKKIEGDTISGDWFGGYVSCKYEYRPVMVAHEGKLFRDYEDGMNEKFRIYKEEKE